MNIQVNSDIHLEFHALPKFQFKEDVLILAGDITREPHQYTKFIEQINTDKPILIVLGNHEYYMYSIEWKQIYSHYKSLFSRFPNVHLLENESITIDDKTFHGTTLWTNYRNGEDIYACVHGMNDFKFIPIHQTIEKHQTSIRYLEKNVKPGDIVITHHAPSFKSTNEKYIHSTINGGFASDLDELVLKLKPSFWIHGHMHDGIEYKIGETQVICNPRGYPNENPVPYENRIIVL